MATTLTRAWALRGLLPIGISVDLQLLKASIEDLQFLAKTQATAMAAITGRLAFHKTATLVSLVGAVTASVVCVHVPQENKERWFVLAGILAVAFVFFGVRWREKVLAYRYHAGLQQRALNVIALKQSKASGA